MRHDRRLELVVGEGPGHGLGTGSQLACSDEALGSHWAVEAVHRNRNLLDSEEEGSGIRKERLAAKGVDGSLGCSRLAEDSRFEVDSLLHIAEVVAVDMVVVASSSEEGSHLDVVGSRESLVQGSTTSCRAV